MIETARLTLAPVAEEDLPFLVSPAADGESSRCIPSSTARPEDATNGESMETNVFEKRAWLYLATPYGLLLPVWILGVALPAPYDGMAHTALWGLFSVFPVLATLLARTAPEDTSPLHLRPNIRASWKTYLFSAYAPGVAIFLGGLLYFALFPGDLDLTARALVSRYGRFGAPASLGLFSPVKAILLHGIAWGVAHAPLIWFGFNYEAYRNERFVGRRRDSPGENKEHSNEGVV